MAPEWLTFQSCLPSLNPFQTLQRHRNFRLFWFGQTLSLIGTWMQTMAQGWLALELSNSAFLVGLVAAAQSLPILLFSLHAGVVVDRTDKLRLVKLAPGAARRSRPWRSGGSPGRDT